MDFSQIALIFKIISGIIAVLNLIGIVFLFFVNKAAFNKIVTNDLHHVDLKLTSLTEETKKTNEKVGVLAEDIAYIKGKCAANTCVPKKAYRTRRAASVKKGVKKKR